MLDMGTRLQRGDKANFYEAYNSLAKVFRLWLVAYGIGVPVILLPRDAVIAQLKVSSDGRIIIILFLIGVLLQVGLAWLYKLSMWWAYMWETKKLDESSSKFRFIEWFTYEFWIEGLADWITIGLYSAATYKILILVV